VETMDTAADLGPGYSVSTCTSTGMAHSSRFAPADFSLWLVIARLEAGATVDWDGSHGDEAIYVLDGTLRVAGDTCSAGGAVIVESGVTASVQAETPAEIIHVGPTAAAPPTAGLLGPPDPDGHGVHVIPAGDANVIDFSAFAQVSFADGTCPTCRMALFRVDGADEPYVVGSHLHSEDEIIHVLSGALQVGPRRVAAGMSIAIPGGVRYGFRTDRAFSFLNYRADVSTVVTTPGSEPHVETVEALRRVLG
jgi:quercetin dioxygenase-like cupin family protein